MNNEQQTWILKPVKTERALELTRLIELNDIGSCPTSIDSKMEIMGKHFVELDRSGLTRQVEEIVVRGLARSANREKIRQNAPTGTPLLEKRAYELYGEPVTDTIEMVEAILELLNQEKETK